jgi:3-deoxy-D-manno-octulosonate 8-phosphate phosphatase (KDO 8-P phosphatase)
MEKSYKEIMPQITTFIFDVDGVLTDGTVTVFPNGELVRRMNVKDGYALKTAVALGYNVCIITGGTNNSIKFRLNGLGITDIYMAAENKIDQLDEYLEINEISAENVLYMGDDIPDYVPMELVGLPTCPKDAVPEIQNISKYISQKRGGKGCVRDVIEQVLKVQDNWNLHYNTK